MKEYKIIDEPTSTCQKWLNQWKHEFNIEIFGADFYFNNNTRYVAILLSREKKETT